MANGAELRVRQTGGRLVRGGGQINVKFRLYLVTKGLLASPIPEPSCPKLTHWRESFVELPLRHMLLLEMRVHRADRPEGLAAGCVSTEDRLRRMDFREMLVPLANRPEGLAAGCVSAEDRLWTMRVLDMRVHRADRPEGLAAGCVSAALAAMSRRSALLSRSLSLKASGHIGPIFPVRREGSPVSLSWLHL
jgi:hypothetical protein